MTSPLPGPAGPPGLAGPQGALLELDGLSKKFGQVVIAENLWLAIQPGDMVGIVGPNGAGKTSLFGLISGDLAPDGARFVSLDGRLPGWMQRPGPGWESGGPIRCRGRSWT